MSLLAQILCFTLQCRLAQIGNLQSEGYLISKGTDVILLSMKGLTLPESEESHTQEGRADRKRQGSNRRDTLLYDKGKGDRGAVP